MRLPVWSRLHLVAAIAIVLRLSVALWSERISHPDEIFQYLEQAHRFVYGYGFIPWEYRYGIRNFLLPGALTALLEALRIVGLDRPTTYIPVMKSVFAILSVCVVYASYSIARNIFSERSGRAAAILAATWHELLYSSTVPTPEILGTYAIVCAVALATASGTGRRAVLVGLLLGLGVALRLQYAVPVSGIWVLVVLGWKWRLALYVAAAGSAVLIFAGMLDMWTWGIPFVSYYNGVLFNVLYQVSELFGIKPPIWYFYVLTKYSMGLHAVAIGYGLLAWRRCWPVLILLTCVLVPHLLMPHKEYRFLFLAIPLLLILLSDAIAGGLPKLHLLLGKPGAQRAAIASVIAMSVMGCVLWDVYAREGRLMAALDLSRRGDLAGVLDLTSPRAKCGAFYYMHRDVPYYFRRDMDGLPVSDFRLFVSHVVLPATHAEIPGFRVSARHGNVIVLEQASPPAAYRRLRQDGREPRMPGVEDRFAPTVKPRF